eukprot:gnl/Chilomastix_caulleri/3261.p1 GENE.gnl/Chilomastix_caulleri/3261~~gnl/Chilomastix_caulleri/3261.p1  ORF type:complete len:203 (+),score=37.38 gnl/Chilomastix_caulleri/3261:86-610(+)
MGIGPSPNAGRIQTHQQTGIYRIGEGLASEVKVYKPPCVFNASKSVGPIHLVGASGPPNGNTNPIRAPASAIGQTIHHASFNPSPTLVGTGKRCVTTLNVKQPQHTYVRLPNLHPATPETNISPQPRKMQVEDLLRGLLPQQLRHHYPIQAKLFNVLNYSVMSSKSPLYLMLIG